ncbi:hypothetical protein ACVRW4_08600 [Streptococcus phocae subsp. phocae]
MVRQLMTLLTRLSLYDNNGRSGVGLQFVVGTIVRPEAPITTESHSETRTEPITASFKT